MINFLTFITGTGLTVGQELIQLLLYVRYNFIRSGIFLLRNEIGYILIYVLDVNPAHKQYAHFAAQLFPFGCFCFEPALVGNKVATVEVI